MKMICTHRGKSDLLKSLFPLSPIILNYYFYNPFAGTFQGLKRVVLKRKALKKKGSRGQQFYYFRGVLTFIMI